MTVLDEAASRLRHAGVDSPRAEARLLLAHAMGVRQEDIIAGAQPDDTALARFRAAVDRRSAREPFAYIVGRREFFSLDFAVGPGVLIPRPESEMLIEEALRRFPHADETLRVLDLGTGSGCLMLSFLAKRRNATGIGIDRSDVALGFARRNAEQLGLAGQARFLRGNWGESLNARFDLIFVNPPYVKSSDVPTLAPEVGVHEPATALDGGKDGLEAYRRIAPALRDLLGTSGCAFVEIGEGQVEAVSAIFTNANLEIDGTVTDLARIHRCLVVMVASEQHSRANRKKQL
jgi:release factor glutamine methyltransferase